MNFQRITISLPKYLYEELSSFVGKRKLSSFVTEALEKLVLEQKSEAVSDVVNAFFSLRDKTIKVSDKKILEAIKRGRI